MLRSTSGCTNQAEEDWKPVAGFDGYEVSDLGRVRSWRPYRGTAVPRVLSPLDNGHGYKQVTLVCGRARLKRHIHRLVAETFLGTAPFDAAEVCHADGDKGNNSIGNLRWGTHRENAFDLVRSGRHNTTSLSESDVRSIRRALAAGVKQEELAERYAVTQTTISCIKLRRTWQWVCDA